MTFLIITAAIFLGRTLSEVALLTIEQTLRARAVKQARAQLVSLSHILNKDQAKDDSA